MSLSFFSRLLFRERQAQSPQTSPTTSATQPSHKDNSEPKTDAKTEEQQSLKHESSASEEIQSKSTDPVSTDEPMDTQPPASDIIAEPDDEQPKSKLTSRPHSSHTSPKQSSISTNQATASTTMGGASSDEDLPYFPAHPISYFPDEAASMAPGQPPQQRQQQTGPRSIFDREISLYSISEDDVSLMPTLELFQVSVTASTTRGDVVKGHHCKMMFFFFFPQFTVSSSGCRYASAKEHSTFSTKSI